MVIVRLLSIPSVPRSLLGTVYPLSYRIHYPTQDDTLRTITTIDKSGNWGWQASMTCPSSLSRLGMALVPGSGLLDSIPSQWGTKILLDYRCSPSRRTAPQDRCYTAGLPTRESVHTPPETSTIWRSLHQGLEVIWDLRKLPGDCQPPPASSSRTNWVSFPTGLTGKRNQ